MKQDKMDKLEKKRIKAQIKLEKKRAKELKDAKVGVKDQDLHEEEKNDVKPDISRSKKKSSLSKTTEAVHVPWYKDPDWLRAVIGIASLIVAIIAVLITLYM
jgi:hypothetical protein